MNRRLWVAAAIVVGVAYLALSGSSPKLEVTDRKWGDVVWITCHNLPGDAQAWVVLGDTVVNKPVGFNTLVPYPKLIFPWYVHSYGTLNAPIPVPAAAPAFWVQVWIKDGIGWSSSNAELVQW